MYRIYSFLFLLLSCLIIQPVMAERDSGASHNLLLKAGINEDWFLISRSNSASRNDFDDRFFGYTGFGLGYRLSDTLSLRNGYRHVWIRPGQDWLEEDRLYTELYYAKKLESMRLSNRARLELRFFDYKDNDLRLRNEIALESRTPIPGTPLRPYLEEEFFYSTRDDRFEANWLGAGRSWRPAKGVKLKLGYRWNRFRVGRDWRHRDVLVTGVNLFF